MAMASIFNQKQTSAQVVVHQVLKIKKGEKVLIIANPKTAEIAQDLYTVCSDAEADTVLMYQREKTSMDNAEPSVLAAIKSAPDVIMSISSQKLGHDAEAEANPYVGENGVKYDSAFDYLLEGKKSIRAIWTPGLTPDMFERTANIDYGDMGERCKKLAAKFKGAVSVRVTAPGGTNISVPVQGREALLDDGDFSKPGLGGNIPAGEVFISPVVGNGVDSGCDGTIVYDGSMTFGDGDSIINTPIVVKVEHGFVSDISGGDEAKRLLKTITDAEAKSVQMEKKGALPQGQGEVYKKNARNIGELGIGMNPSATISGNMLEDEKAFQTCHFAIGCNYDDDAPCLIHLDGVVRLPTIVISYADGSSFTALENGVLKV